MYKEKVLNVSELAIKHRTECIPGLFRNEIYEFDDLVYVEQFDDASGERIIGTISMYNGIKVCNVNADGSIGLNLPTGWVTNHDGMMELIVDVKRLDAFIAAVCEKYH